MTQSLHLKDDIIARWFLYQTTSDNFWDRYDKGGQSFYFGCDPTAESLHLGNFVVFMNAVNFMKRGNKLILIIGGETWSIGDPGGKDAERTLLDQTTVDNNVIAIHQQVSRVLRNLSTLTWQTFDFEVINNHVFYENMTFSSFLRDVGKYITINQMMSKETVKKRIDDPDKSISFTEFSYMLLQGYDYRWLHTHKGVNLQISGSDQRGNMVTGVELISKKTGNSVDAMTSPLILDATGKKFGKSEWNALWLDPIKNHPYIVHQYFINTADADVERFLKLFTLLSLDEIQTIVETHMEAPERRYGQTHLANYVVETIFGTDGLHEAQAVSGFIGSSSEEKLAVLESGVPATLTYLISSILTDGMMLTDALVASGLCESKGDAKKLIQWGGISVNEVKVGDVGYVLDGASLIGGACLVRQGKNKVRILAKG
jgi:tyrosyl-tRNA synthetase